MTTRRVLQLASLIVAVGALVIWLATGANRGWTKTSRPVMTRDEVTGIEGPTSHEKTFSPGVDFLFGAWVGGAVLACGALLFRNKPKPKTETAES
jgi:hypothetical protein